MERFDITTSVEVGKKIEKFFQSIVNQHRTIVLKGISYHKGHASDYCVAVIERKKGEEISPSDIFFLGLFCQMDNLTDGLILVNAQLSELIKRKNDELRRLQKERDELEEERDELQAERDELEEERDELQEERDKLQEERDELDIWDLEGHPDMSLKQLEAFRIVMPIVKANPDYIINNLLNTV